MGKRTSALTGQTIFHFQKFLFCILIALMLTAALMAESNDRRKDESKVLGDHGDFNSARENKMADVIDSEWIYVSEELESGSFKRDMFHKFRCRLYYSCPSCAVHKTSPGLCNCGTPLMLSFEHGKKWHFLCRDADGQLLIDPLPIVDIAEPTGPPQKRSITPNTKTTPGPKAAPKQLIPFSFDQSPGEYEGY